nr:MULTISPECIES: hypothetical protein [Cryobacterium]
MNPERSEARRDPGRNDDDSDERCAHGGGQSSHCYSNYAGPSSEVGPFIKRRGGGDACKEHDYRGFTPLLEPESEAETTEADPAEPDGVGTGSENEHSENKINFRHGVLAFVRR